METGPIVFKFFLCVLQKRQKLIMACLISYPDLLWTREHKRSGYEIMACSPFGKITGYPSLNVLGGF